MKVILSILFISLSVGAYEVTDNNERNPKQISIKGFKDTPKQAAPFDQWHVHDPDRPQPAVAAPKYDGEPVPAPQGAKILLGGTDLKQWKNKKWELKNNIMTVAAGNQETTEKFQDIHLHIEWKAPERQKGWGQTQGNSGIYLMGLYEVQVLNCWANRTYPDGMTGAIYGQRPPEYNACKKPGEWQSYDIHFKAPIFKKINLSSPAYITVLLNGVKIHDNYAIKGSTKYRQLAAYRAHVSKGPIMLQAHGNPVSFRNIWVTPLKIKLGK